MNSDHQPKRGLAPKLSGGSMVQRLIIVVVGGLILVMLAVILFSVAFKGSGGSTAQLTDLAQQQNEIARVADIGIQKATSTATKNFAHTVKLSMLSSQQQIIALQAKNHHKVNTKLLGIKANSVTDQQLTAAAANNSFDATFTKLMTDELASYRVSLQSDYKTSTSVSEKQLLQTGFDGVGLLIGDKQSS